jgi:hypothetical protein
MRKALITSIVCFVCVWSGLSTSKAQTNIFPSYFEGFESSNGNWSASGTNSTWAWGSPASGILTTSGEGTRCWKTNLTGNYLANDASFLTSPALDFTCFATDPTISFLKWQQIETNYDYLDLQLSTDGGSTWTTLGTTASGGTNWYTHSSNRWNGAQTTWTSCSHVMTGMAGKANVRMRFRFTSDGSVQQVGVGIDAIRIEVPGGPTTAPPPTLTSPIDGAANQPLAVTVNWSTSICAQSYEVQVSTSSTFATTFFTQSGLTVGSASLTGLAFETVYFWRVRSILNGVPGAWSPTRSFSTIPPPPGIPVLISPADNAVNLDPPSVFLLWTPDSRATSYRVQMARDAAFTQILVDKSTTSASEDVRSLMGFGTRYYWRANASNASGTSAWSPVWTFATALPTPSLAFPPDNEKELSIPVRLDWNGLAGINTYTLQVAKDQTFTDLVFNGDVTGFQAFVSMLEYNMRYFWRIRAVGAGGITSNYTPSRAFSTLVSTPKLTVPNDGAVDIATQGLTLSWLPNPTAVEYRVQISTSSLFNNTSEIIFDQKINGLTTTVNNLPNNKLLYWRVRAESVVLGASYWSEPFTFTTILTSVTNMKPEDNSLALNFPLRMEWTSAGEQVSYDIQIATDNNFKNIALSRIVDNLEMLDIGALDGLQFFTQYWWRVRPRSRSGQDIPWSPSYTFTTKIGSATVISPMDKSTDQSLRSRYMWSTVSGAEQYSLVVSKSSDLSNPIISVDNVSNTEYSSLAELELSTTYYWQVRSISSSNGSSDSPVWSFTTASAKVASAPDLIMPAANAVVAAGRIELQWSSVEGATSYDVEVSDNQTFSTIAYSGAGQTASSWSIDVTESSRTLYWRVRSVNSAGTGAWSSWRRFSTSASALLAPELLSPPRNAVRVEPTVIFVWNEVSNAVSYHIQVSTDANFGTLVYSKNKLIGLSTLPLNLNSSMTYYWRVLSENEQGESVWSPVWSFTTSSGTTSVSEDVSANTIRVTPHPVVGLIGLTIELEGMYEVALLGMNGEIVQNLGKAIVGRNEYSTEGLSSGMYILRISNGKSLRHIPIIIAD